MVSKHICEFPKPSCPEPFQMVLPMISPLSPPTSTLYPLPTQQAQHKHHLLCETFPDPNKQPYVLPLCYSYPALLSLDHHRSALARGRKNCLTKYPVFICTQEYIIEVYWLLGISFVHMEKLRKCAVSSSRSYVPRVYTLRCSSAGKSLFVDQLWCVSPKRIIWETAILDTNQHQSHESI